MMGQGHLRNKAGGLLPYGKSTRRSVSVTNGTRKKSFLLQRGVNKARNNQVWGSGVGGRVTGQWMEEECSPKVRPFQERLEKWTCSLSQ